MTDRSVVDEQERGADLKDLFPHDRVVFFCDAVFAIAITLLAIELKLPGQEAVGQLAGQHAAHGVTALFVSYIVSFVVTGLFWTGHMQTWRHVRHVNGRLVWATLLQLMFVALMPFATREYSEYFASNSPGRLAFYAFVLAGIALFAQVSRAIVVRQENLRERLGETATRWLVWRGVVPLVLFALAIPLAFVLPVWCGGLMFLTIFPCLAVTKRWIQRSPRDAA